MLPPISLLDIGRSFKIGDQADQRRAQMSAADLAAQGDLQAAAAAAMRGGAPEGMSLLNLDAQNRRAAEAKAMQEREFQANQAYRNQSLDISRQRIAAGNQGEFGLNPVFVRNPDGTVSAFQPSKAGGMRRLETPDGAYVMGPGDKAADSAAGKLQGTNAANLPLAEAGSERLVRAIDDTLGDPALPNVTGPMDSWLPTIRGDSRRAQSRLDQIQGATFLQAYNDLRGGGQITEAEGAKATAAYNRLSSTGMSDADYRKALEEFKSEVVRLRDIARQRAAPRNGPQPAPAGMAPAAPAPPAGNARPRATNAAGQVMEYNGTAWVPIQ